MGILSEFREFAMKGNVLDLAIGIIIGAAFGRVVSSLVDNILMPPIGLAIGGVDFSALAIILREGTATSPPVAIRYGAFIQNVIDFLIVAWAVFWVVKAFNRLRRKEERTGPEPPPSPTT